MKQENIERPWWLNEESETILKRGYFLEGEELEDALERICSSVVHYLGDVKDPLIKDKFKHIIRKGWMSLSSPVWANAGTDRGLPISCMGLHVNDDMGSIIAKHVETAMHTKRGAGTSGYFGDLRGRGSVITNNGESSGAVSFMRMWDTMMQVVSQGSTRRGSFAAYLPIDHPDIEEFIRIKSIGHDIQNIFHAVCVPDYWMQEMIDGDVDKRTIWAKVLQARQQTGLPYIFFSDNVNNNKPDIYKATNSEIQHSNLCAEIALPDNANETFICCLCSINLALYDEWIKECPELPELATYFLDGVISEYIDKTKDDPYMQPAYNFAVRHRAIGIGVMGWHSYLQSNMIAFESLQANLLTNKIFRHISDGTKKASEELARLLGPAPIFNEKMSDGSLYKGIKYRNTTTMAIAPTTSSSAILGQVSPGIEPYISNYYKAGLAKGNFMRRNKYLERLLKEKDQNTEAVWKSIMEHQGSVQHLDFLSDDEKAVFKTFREISQHDLITQAGIRQKYIDQSQSLNLCIPPSLPVKDVNALMIYAWQSGIKSLYYQRSVSVSKDTLSKVTVCSSCEA